MPLSVKDMRKYGCVKTDNEMGAVPDSLFFLKIIFLDQTSLNIRGKFLRNYRAVRVEGITG